MSHGVLQRQPWADSRSVPCSMDLYYLAKLLLQHDDNPLVGSQDVQAQLLVAAEEDRVKCCASPRGPGVAVALDQRMVVVQQSQPSQDARRIGGDAVEFAMVVEAPERVTAIAWLAGRDQPTEDCLLLGTSAGYLQVHSPSGQLLHRQDLHEGPLASIAIRWGGMGLDPGELSEDVIVCAADAVLRLPCWDICAVARWHTGRRERGWWGMAPAPPELGITKWTLPKGTGPRSYAMSLGAPLPSLYSVLRGRSQGDKVQLFTAGRDPPLATLEADEAKGAGILSLVSGLASSTASGLLNRAKGALPMRVTVAGGAREGKPKREKIVGGPATVAASVWDEKRMIQRVSPSPCGTLAACCDNLGRVMLVDTAATLVLRMLKGYRDAQVAWLVAPASSGLQRSRRRQKEEGGNGSAAGRQQGEGAGVAQRAQQAGQGRGERPGARHQSQRAQHEAGPLPPSLAEWESRWSDSDSEAPTPGSRQQFEQQGQGLQGSAVQQLEQTTHADAQAAEGQRGGPGQAMGGPGAEPATADSALQAGPGSAGAPQEGAEGLAAAPGVLAGSPAQDMQAVGQSEAQQDSDLPRQGLSQASLASSSGSVLADEEGQEPSQPQQMQQQVYVVVYAPRRAVVELWQPHSGRRVAAVRFPLQHGMLLQQPAQRAGRLAGLAEGAGSRGARWPRAYATNSVWMLDLESLSLVDLVPVLLG